MSGMSVAEIAGEQAALLLPAFLEQRPDGIYVDLTRLPSAEEFARVVERIFSSGQILRGLDYPRFQRLLFSTDSLRDEVLSLRLASELAGFPEARQALYRPVALLDGRAEYIFEPVALESTVDEPVYALGENGDAVVEKIVQRQISTPATLDFDEFVAYLWLKGVRFGIDEPRVRAAMQSGKTERVVVANERLALPGRDAGVEEKTEALHRSDAPRRLPDGRVDLGQFSNRFPQIQAETRILMKTPRQLGQPGRRLNGDLLEPPLPQDLDLASLAGPGTRIEEEAGYAYIVAAIDGFLNLDSRSNLISVTEKIINREGVSARTTGNLALSGQDYEEFGEVQEGRTVEGYNLNFHADVYGRVASAGGLIRLERNLVGGSAINRSGDIEVGGLASSASLQTMSGKIRVKRAENCLIVGDDVELEWACRCVVLANSLRIGEAESCTLAGKQLEVGSLAARRDQENLLSLLLPDLSGFERRRGEEEAHLAECREMVEQLRIGMRTLASQPEIQQYLALSGKLKRKEIVLDAARSAAWQQMGKQLAPALKRMQQAREDVAVLEDEIQSGQARLLELDEEQQRAGEGIFCRLGPIQGETVVRGMVVPLAGPSLQRLPPRELSARLRTRHPGETVFFSGVAAGFNWPA